MSGDTHVMLNTLQANVLISNHNPPRARLADFGLNAIMFDVFSMTKASVNWTAPEIFDSGGRDFKPTFASDIYALGMLIYEVICSGGDSAHSDGCSFSIGAYWTLSILLQTHESGSGISSDQEEQATASSTRL